MASDRRTTHLTNLIVREDLTVEGATTHDGLLNADGGIAVDTNKFTVADGTGNTVVGGTLGVTGVSTLSDTLVLPKTSGKGIKVNTASPAFGWRDIIGNVQPKATGAGSPARTTYQGNIGDYAFALNDVCDFIFHIPHDYVPGTDMYFHVHWSHTDSVSITGNAVFTFYFSYSKGHNQAIFPAEKTATITYATTNLSTTPQYQHRIDEVAISGAAASGTVMDRSLIEVDGLVQGTLKLTGIPTFGGTGKLFIHTCDIHYQSTNMATSQKSPNPTFYS